MILWNFLSNLQANLYFSLSEDVSGCFIKRRQKHWAGTPTFYMKLQPHPYLHTPFSPSLLGKKQK
jgi:hypothetical protein